MRRRILSGLIAAVFLITALPALAEKAPKPEDVKKYPSCKFCGMNRGMFNYSRMLTTYNDGSQFGACSLHCAAIDLVVSMGKSPASIQVADYNTKQLIDAEKATWVIGGKKPGVMTRVAKWAFAKPEEATAFIKTNGGKVASFDDAIRVTFEDMYADTKMIRAKKAKMKEKMKEKMQMKKKEPQKKS